MGPAPRDPDRAPRQELLELLARNGRAFRRTATRFSLCPDDADDAYQYAVEILLEKAPAIMRPQLVAWMQTVTRREALRIRHFREQELGPAWDGEADGPDQVLARIASERPGPAEIAERREYVREATRALARLKPDERLAIVLQAQGYSYAEICRMRGWTHTKVNRSLAEGRERLRRRSAGLAA